ncbi:MAG: hypothetical protein AAGA42_20920 [Actinomycetota bacterium]
MSSIAKAALVVGGAWLVAGCGQPAGEDVTVEPYSVEISEDRLSVTVAFSTPVDGVDGCGLSLSELIVEADDEVARIVASVSAPDPEVGCRGLCGELTQTVTLTEPLPDDVNWEWPTEARSGCAPTQLR